MLWLPLRTDARLESRPWAHWLILAVIVSAFAAQRLGGDLDYYLALNSRDPRLPQFLTYAFLHVGWLHLLGNLLALWIFGPNVNDRLGQAGYMAFYMAGTVAGGCAFVLTSRSGAVEGASGAAGAAMGAYLVLLPRSSITLWAAVAPLRVPALPFVIIYFLFNVAMGLAAVESVAHVTHVAGMVLGALSAVVLVRARLVKLSGDELFRPRQ